MPSLTGERWKFKTGGEVSASPVVVDSRVFIGGEDGIFYALDAKTGAPVWTFKTEGKITGSATVDRNNVVYFGSEDGFLYALKAADGKEVWRFAADPAKPGAKPVSTSPAVAYGVVFAGFGTWGGNYLGIDATTGKKVWKLRRFVPNGGPLGPTINGGLFHAPVNDNVLLHVDLRTEIPLRQTPGHHCRACVVAADGLILYSRGPSFAIFNEETGARIFEKYTRGSALSFFPESAPAWHDGVAWCAKEDKNVYAFEVKDGAARELWAVPTPAIVRSSITVAGGEIFFGCDDGNLYALDAKTGAEKWKYKTGAPVCSTPWLADGVLYVGSEDGHVYALR